MVDLIVQPALAVLLFWVTNWLGRHSDSYGYVQISVYETVEQAPAFNVFYRLLAPQVFIVLVATAIAVLHLPLSTVTLWRVTGLSFVIRWAFNILTGRALLIGWASQVVVGVAATLLSYALATQVLVEPSRVLPDPKNLMNELWLIVIIFLYQVFNRTTVSDGRREARRIRYIRATYTKLRSRFQGVIADQVADQWAEALVYCVLMLEHFNRPPIARLIERRLLFPLGLAKTIGPMQVTATVPVTDDESVGRGAAKIAADYAVNLTKWNSRDLEERAGHYFPQGSKRVRAARDAALVHNADGAYADEIVLLYRSVLREFYPQLVEAEPLDPTC
jgi:hypothetical protein